MRLRFYNLLKTELTQTGIARFDFTATVYNIAHVQSQCILLSCTSRHLLPNRLCLMRLRLTEDFLQTFLVIYYHSTLILMTTLYMFVIVVALRRGPEDAKTINFVSCS